MTPLSPDEERALAQAGFVADPARLGRWLDAGGDGHSLPASVALRMARGAPSTPNGRAPAAATAEALIEPPQENDSMDREYTASATEQPDPADVLGPCSLTVDGARASIALPDYSLSSYESFVRIKAALPRFDLEDPFPRYARTARPRITCAALDLAAVGLRAEAPRVSLDETAALFEDQRWVVEMAFARQRFAVFAEAGWGKTVAQLSLARAAARATGLPSLIVAPLSVVPQTAEERARFWPGEAPLVDVRAAGGVRAWLDSDPGPALGIVNVDAFRKPVDLAGLGCFVLDESSCLKNMAGVVRNVLVRAVAPVPYRFAFSATPAPNDLEEYVSHALFLGVIKQHKEFFADFFDTDGEGGWHLRPHAREAFYRFMSTWSVWIRRPERYGFPARLGGVPAVVFEDIEVELTPEQRAESAVHRKPGSLLLDEVGVVKRSKLAQISRGFVYEGEGARRVARPIRSLKPAAVAAFVARFPGQRAVVWVTFDEEAAILADALRAAGRTPVVVDGTTPEADRWAAVREINGGAGRDTLIAKPETLGFGINLQGASVVAYSGIGDSFEKDYQSLRRAFRYGQRRAIHCGYILTSLERMMLDNVRAKRAAWEAQTLAMEDAFADAHGPTLSAYRGAASAEAERTAFVLSPEDRRLLAGLS